MNSYNENLQNTVSATLQNQNLNLKGLRSQYKASMYSLYYAEGATITAEEKLGGAAVDLTDAKAPAKQAAVKNTSISANQLNSSTQANQYAGQSVSNVATCASNVQIAATGITRLAGDIGSIFSIVNAADFGSDIYTLTDTVNDLINTTAFNAEYTSQLAMEATAATSEVSASTVLNDAKATNALMNNVLQVANADFNNASQLVTSDNATLASVTAIEKLAEGVLESSEIDYLTGLSAYESVNLGLNLGLTAFELSPKSFLVFFERIRLPFSPPPNPDITPIVVTNGPWYPVSDYNVFVVKESKQLTFSISEAENLRINEKECYVKIKRHFKEPVDEILLPGDMLAEVVEYTHVLAPDGRTYHLRDSDGHPVEPGNKYVVFIMAVYTDAYKRLINNFDDYLSAPSLPFSLTTLLHAAKDVAVWPLADLTPEAVKTKEPKGAMFTKLKHEKIDISLITDQATKGAKYLLLFTVEPPADKQTPPLAYKCMFLPVAVNMPDNLMTRRSFDAYVDDQIRVDKVKLQTTLSIIDQTIKELQERLKTEVKEKNADGTERTVVAHKKEIEKYMDLLTAKQTQLNEPPASTPTQFFFNKALAEIVPAGSSTLADQFYILKDDNGKPNAVATGVWYAFIDPATTDNFGNLLMTNAGKVSYAPAVLSLVSSDDEKIVRQYTTNISAIETSNAFTY